MMNGWKEVVTMFAYDYSRLLGRIKEKGYTQKALAKAVGVSESSLNLKLQSKNTFRQDEIVRISNVLGISLAECDQYFFAH